MGGECSAVILPVQVQSVVSGKDVSVDMRVHTCTLSSRNHKTVGEIFVFRAEYLLFWYCCVLFCALNHNVEFWSLIWGDGLNFIGCVLHFL